MISKLFSTIILFGAVQGFIVSTLLFFSQKNKRPNRILAFLLLIISLASFKLYGNYVDWFGSALLQVFTQFVPLILLMAVGPLVYFYVRSVLDPEFTLTKKDRRHFYPVIIDLVPMLTLMLYYIGLLTKSINNDPGPWGRFIDNYNVYSDVPRWASISLYLWLSLRYLSAYKAKRNGIMNGQLAHFNWLNQFIRVFMVFQAIWLLYLMPYVIPRYTDWVLKTFDWYPVYLPLAVIIYWLGIKGYVISQNQFIGHKKSPLHSNLTTDQVKEVTDTLQKTMEEDHAYLNPNLSLAVLADTTGLSQRVISIVLNQHMQKSFNNFVNEYRVRECTEKMTRQEGSNLTIAGIALECGFSSQATFQRVFKAMTGLTPREYISKQPRVG
ncbi:MAG TPA: helix-turn-helix domain-containing protein [Chryseolinea sp.]|nr:helix-turn-helix domain-containing protein [Chryseolinea sp.]